MVNTNFDGLQIDNNLHQKNRTNSMSVKFGGAYYAFRMKFVICNIDTLKSVFSKTTEICWLSCAKK